MGFFEEYEKIYKKEIDSISEKDESDDTSAGEILEKINALEKKFKEMNGGEDEDE